MCPRQIALRHPRQVTIAEGTRVCTAGTEPDRLVLACLADGRLHSGVDLARVLGVTRAAVWKRIASLAALGVALDRVRGRGYRLAQPIEMLDARHIVHQLRPATRHAVRDVRVEFAIDSTNLALLNQDDCHGRLLLAEYQRRGRGRRGNRWISPPATGVCLSLGWRYEQAPPAAGALSMLAGAALLRSLRRCGIEVVGLKWPNDLVCKGRKLGGLLIESRGQHAGPMEVVIGVGVNVTLPGGLQVPGDNAPIDLARCSAAPPSRNRLAAFIADELVEMLTALETGRIDAYRDDWRRHDAGAGRDATLRLTNETLHGRVLGITDSGMLRMLVNGKEREFSAGDLSLRLH
jgi:BirA family biotin operon repressor/biotin-[acetyl-CoA-carboxylase] ligase